MAYSSASVGSSLVGAMMGSMPKHTSPTAPRSLIGSTYEATRHPQHREEAGPMSPLEEALSHFNRYLTARDPEFPVEYTTVAWELEHDTDPENTPMLARRISWCHNDDGCFIFLLAQWGTWGRGSDTYTLEKIVFSTSEDDEFYNVPVEP